MQEVCDTIIGHMRRVWVWVLRARLWVRVRVLCVDRVRVLKNMDSSPTQVHCRTRVLIHHCLNQGFGFATAGFPGSRFLKSGLQSLPKPTCYQSTQKEGIWAHWLLKSRFLVSACCLYLPTKVYQHCNSTRTILHGLWSWFYSHSTLVHVDASGHTTTPFLSVGPHGLGYSQVSPIFVRGGPKNWHHLFCTP